MGSVRQPMVQALLRTVCAILISVVCGAMGVYGASEWKLRHTHDVPLSALRTDLGSVNLPEGRRWAQLLGCWAGCHGKEGHGGQLDMDGYYTITAPNLSAVIPPYTDPELIRLIRFGVKRDGSSALGMISYTFFPLGDADLANVIAFLRLQPEQMIVGRKRAIEFQARIRLLFGKWQVAADQVNPKAPRWGELPRTNAFERGRYLASVTCSECHGVDFRGNTFEDNTYDGGPSLAVVAIYGPEEFQKLLHSGEPIGARQLGEMGWVARNAFVHFTREEVGDIYTFLREYHSRK